MKLQELFENLFEAPLPDNYPPNIFDPKPGKYTSASIIKKFEELYHVRIGKGSSRIAFLVNVDASKFPADILRKHNLPSSGIVETVIKLALNSRGISQNAAEINTYDNFGHHDDEYGKYLLPILDTSARNKDIHMDDVSLSNWIQFPRCYKPSIPQFKAWFKSEFGNFIDKFADARDVHDLYSIDLDSYSCSDDQIDNWGNFVGLLDHTEMGIQDVKRMANLGVFNGRIYILDYGFDSSTMALYQGREKAHAFVDNSGNIRLTTTKIQPKSRW